MNIDMKQYMERRDECVYLSKEFPPRIELILTELIPAMEQIGNPFATMEVKSLLGSYLEALDELAYLKETLKELAK